ncbi:putative Prephenate dehydrogenase [uncultured delta proteobacterium]|uniref:Putative Prephenate dehydrogenase n=1 Tax=uncultured delta proteobacterium TaxID=34034 RepID=A0A212K0S6_9DELT|nr:putative Prephenate dehydrogenase [uncultured delta proteobacterium]
MNFSVTLVGTRGRMGAMFHEAWGKRRPVHVVNRTRDGSGRAAFRDGDLANGIPLGDVVLLCVPAPAMPETLDRIRPYLREGQILSDVCSVKINPMRWMEERFDGPVVGTHPLFGPENGQTGGKVALVRGKNATDEAMDRVASLFREIGCVPFTATAAEHDSAVGITQSLHFALSAAYFSAAARHENLAPYVTPSFLRFLEAARSELTSGAAMFGEFSAANPLFPGILKELAATLQTAGPDELEKMVAEARVWFEE